MKRSQIPAIINYLRGKIEGTFKIYRGGVVEEYTMEVEDETLWDILEMAIEFSEDLDEEEYND